MLQLQTERMQAHSSDGIGWRIFNNPARHNALSLEMWQGMHDILSHFAQDPEVRVVIMRGAGGKAFVSGADISEFDQHRANAEQRASYGEVAGKGSRALNHFEKPLIALIEGYCIGGGLATALSADIRICTPDSRFGIPAAKLGLGYEYPGVAKLARIVGPARARDIFFSARFMPAEEAKSMGLVNFVYEREQIESQTIEYAQRIAGNAPLTIHAAKKAVDAWEAGGKSEALDEVQQLVDQCFNSADYKEGRRAFAAKERPDFSGR